MPNHKVYNRVFTVMENVAKHGRKSKISTYEKPYIKYDKSNNYFIVSDGITTIIYKNHYLEELPNDDAYYVYEEGLLQQISPYIDGYEKIRSYKGLEQFIQPCEGAPIQYIENLDNQSDTATLFMLSNEAMHRGVYLAGEELMLLTKVAQDLKHGKVCVYDYTKVNEYLGQREEIRFDFCRFDSKAIIGLSVIMLGTMVKWND